MDYAYNNGMADPMQQQQQQLPGMNGQQQQQMNFNGGTGLVRNLPMNKTIRGLPPVVPDPAIIQQQHQTGLHNNMMMNADPNNPNHLYGHPNNVAPPKPTTAPTSAPLSSHFSFFGMGGGGNNQQQQQQQQQQSTGPSFIQKMMGGGGAAAAPTTTTTTTTTSENPVEGLLSKGKDLIFKKFGL